MTLVAPHITAYLRERLPNERKASPHTAIAMLMPFSCSSSSPASGWAVRRLHSSWSNSMHLWCWLSSNIFKRTGVTALPHETHVWRRSSHLCTSSNTVCHRPWNNFVRC